MPYKLLQPPVIQMAALGVLTGILSSFKLGPLGDLEILTVPVQQGILFGGAIAYGMFRWGETGWIGALITVLTVLIAWIAAHNCFTLTYGTKLTALPSFPVAALAAGAVGATGTIFAGALTTSALRHWTAWLTTISLGTVLGLLSIFAMQNEDEYLLLLFVPWQAMVAASIGYALAITPQKHNPQ